MARYEIELRDDTVIQADDARYACGGKFIEFIPRRASITDGLPETCALHVDFVRLVRHTPIGFKGGWRFSGEKDSDYRKSEGSI